MPTVSPDAKMGFEIVPVKSAGRVSSSRNRRPGAVPRLVRRNDFHLEADYWIGALPLNGRLGLTISWARFGLVGTVWTLTLDHCDGLAADALQLGE